jgi:hypothetical protein
MSRAPSHDQPATAVSTATESETRSARVERAIAFGYALAVSTAMIGWLYMLALAFWDGARWLMS